jgi:hypothetical protein
MYFNSNVQLGLLVCSKIEKAASNILLSFQQQMERNAVKLTHSLKMSFKEGNSFNNLMLFGF